MGMNADPTYPLFPVFAFCTFFLVLIPLPLHIQAWNVGTCSYIFWVAVSCLLEFVNSIVWRNNVLNPAPVWCDISSKIILGASVGIPAAGLCISRRLYIISSIRSTIKTRADKRRAVILDSCIAFGIPILVMALHYAVQGHRFDILEAVGCYASIYDTLLAYFLVLAWPTILGCVSFVLSAFTLRAFHRRRMEFSQFLSTYSSLSMNRYIRLMMLALAEMLCTIPISIYSVYIANKGVPIQPWISWADTHYEFSYVGQVPAVVWMSDPNFRLSVELTRWLYPASGLLFFLLFGLGSEARKGYRAAFLRVAKFCGHKPTPELSSNIPRQWMSGLNKNISAGSLPVYNPATSPHAKHANSAASSAAKCFTIDVEKAAGCSSPSLPSYSSQERQPSPTATCIGTVGSEDVETGPTAAASVYHGPFSPPSVYPVPRRMVQESRSLDSICITIQTHHATTI